jgi:thiol-disulfide isomerase/thioredoxin
MKNIMYLLGLALLCFSCNAKSPEKDYQACTAAEEAYNKNATDSLFEQTKAIYADFYKNNINTAFGQKIFSESKWTRRLNAEQLNSVIQVVTDMVFKETDAYKNAADRLFRMKTTVPGNPFTNIIAKDPEGNTIELVNYVGKGKYVLLNFWASWCPDCRKEMPELVKLYAAYKDKNFEMIGYSLDKDKDAWKKGIETLNITWTQFSDCDYWNSQGAKLYAVQFIPQTILINPDGTIIERGLDIDALKVKLSNLIKNN